MQVHLISGFLGSGKTTAIQTASKLLFNQHCKVGVILNDQGMKLVDTGFFQSLSIPNRQVSNGCFCCHYDALNTCIDFFIEEENAEIVFAESVGSCTDIVATVLKPLQQMQQDIQVTISTFADARLLHLLLIQKKPLFDKPVMYIYEKQLEEAGVIVVTKIDLMGEDELTLLEKRMKDRFPLQTILFVNATETDSIQKWLAEIRNFSQQPVSISSLQIDYDLYGAGEAMLAWLDEELVIHSEYGKATQIAIELVNSVCKKIRVADYPIGHLKCLINDVLKISFTSTSQSRMPVRVEPASQAKLLINGRIQTSPDLLKSLVEKVIDETAKTHHCQISVLSVSSFQPGYPTPTHRIG